MQENLPSNKLPGTLRDFFMNNKIQTEAHSQMYKSISMPTSLGVLGASMDLEADYPSITIWLETPYMKDDMHPIVTVEYINKEQEIPKLQINSFRDFASETPTEYIVKNIPFKNISTEKDLSNEWTIFDNEDFMIGRNLNCEALPAYEFFKIQTDHMDESAREKYRIAHAVIIPSNINYERIEESYGSDVFNVINNEDRTYRFAGYQFELCADDGDCFITSAMPYNDAKAMIMRLIGTT